MWVRAYKPETMTCLVDGLADPVNHLLSVRRIEVVMGILPPEDPTFHKAWAVQCVGTKQCIGAFWFEPTVTGNSNLDLD